MGRHARPHAFVTRHVPTSIDHLAARQRDCDSVDQLYRRAANIAWSNSGLRSIAPGRAPRLGLRHAWPGSRTGRAVRAMGRCGAAAMGDCSGAGRRVLVIIAKGISGAMARRRWAVAAVCNLRAETRQRRFLADDLGCRPRACGRRANRESHVVVRHRPAFQ